MKHDMDSVREERIRRLRHLIGRMGEDGGSALDEANEAGDELRAVTAFIEWLRGNGMDIGLVPVIPGSLLIPLPDPPEKLAAAFYDIDYDQLVADRAEYVYRHQMGEP